MIVNFEREVLKRELRNAANSGFDDFTELCARLLEVMERNDRC